jgi:hypothetical protein
MSKQISNFSGQCQNKYSSKSFAQKFELKWSLGGPLSKLCVIPPFSINFRCQIENQVSDYKNLISFWFVIKQKLTTKEISIFGYSSHFEWRAALSDTILKRDHPRTIPAKFALIWFSGFRGEDLNVIFYLLKIEMSSIVHCCFSISQNELKFEMQLHGKEYFNIYSRFFCEIFLSADLYRICKLDIF